MVQSRSQLFAGLSVYIYDKICNRIRCVLTSESGFIDVHKRTAKNYIFQRGTLTEHHIADLCQPHGSNLGQGLAIRKHRYSKVSHTVCQSNGLQILTIVERTVTKAGHAFHDPDFLDALTALSLIHPGGARTMSFIVLRGPTAGHQEQSGGGNKHLIGLIGCKAVQRRFVSHSAAIVEKHTGPVRQGHGLSDNRQPRKIIHASHSHRGNRQRDCRTSQLGAAGDGHAAVFVDDKAINFIILGTENHDHLVIRILLGRNLPASEGIILAILHIARDACRPVSGLGGTSAAGTYKSVSDKRGPIMLQIAIRVTVAYINLHKVPVGLDTDTGSRNPAPAGREAPLLFFRTVVQRGNTIGRTKESVLRCQQNVVKFL